LFGAIALILVLVPGFVAIEDPEPRIETELAWAAAIARARIECEQQFMARRMSRNFRPKIAASTKSEAEYDNNDLPCDPLPNTAHLALREIRRVNHTQIRISCARGKVCRLAIIDLV
jgi:hypothetical protein